MNQPSSTDHAARPDSQAGPLRGRPRRRAAWAVLSALAAVSALVVALVLGTRFDPFGRARASYDRSEFRSALRSAREYLARRPGDRRASLLAARCLTRLGLVREAEEHYQNAGPLGPDGLQDRAYGLVQLGEPERAAGVYQELLARRPDDALALKRLAAIRMAQKRWRPVLELADRLIRIPSEEVAGRTLAGIGHHETKHYEQAVASSLRVLELDPGLKAMPLPRTLFWNNLALDLMAGGRTAEARDYLTRALAGGDDAGLMELLGLTHHLDGATAEAERCWRLALEWDPGHVDAALELGRLAMSRGRWDEAVRLLERVAERSPEMVEPAYSLAQAYRHLGNEAEAERYRQRAARLRQSRPRPGASAAGVPVPSRPGSEIRETAR